MVKIWNELFDYTLQAKKNAEVPVAAAIVRGNEILFVAHNQVEALEDPTAHAEMIVIKEAFQKQGKNLKDFDLYVTLEPCPMCTEAIRISQVSNLYFGAYDPKNGAVEHGPKLLDKSPHPKVYGGFHEERFGKVLKDFFGQLRS